MKRDTATMTIGLLLVLGGFLFLLANFGILPNLGALFIALAFGAAGAVFLFVFLSKTEQNWWAVFPGFALLGIGSLIALSTLFPRAGELLGGALFLGALSLSFWIVYLMRPERWWAVIPGGALLTLSVVALLGSLGVPFLEQLGGAIFFLGLALTFGLLYFLPTPQGRLTWAVYPAGALFFFGLLALVSIGSIFNFIWPAALILGGLYLVYRNTQRRAQ